MTNVDSTIISHRLAWLKRIFGNNDGFWKRYLLHHLCWRIQIRRRGGGGGGSGEAVSPKKFFGPLGIILVETRVPPLDVPLL